MLENILNDVKKHPVSITSWILGFLGIFTVRFILEALSSPNSRGMMPGDPYTFIHYFLFFLCTVIATAYVIGFITKDYTGSFKLILFGLPIIWIAPILDLVISGGAGYKMTYIFDSHGKLLLDFLTFFGPNLTSGATYGIRIEIAVILLSIGWYVWQSTKNAYKSLLAVVLSYTAGFILATLPGIIFTITNFNAGSTEIVNYFERLVNLSNIYHNTLIEGSTSVSPKRFLELGFNKLLSQILFIISIIFASLFFWKIESKKFVAVIKNIRFERINFYISSLLSGMGFAYINKLGNSFVWVDLLGITCLIISWVALWMHAVHLNDIEDVDIDKISNTERPLVKKELTMQEMSDIGNLWLIIGLLGAWSAGFYPFLMSIVYIGASYIYSVPPLRLRRFPLLPSFLISVVCLATILAGFFFVSVNKEIQVFPPLIALGILVIVTLAINFKDMKDIEGDRANGIITLATFFGEKGPRVIGSLLALSILLTPFFLSFYLLYIFALPASVVGYKIVTKKPYSEKNIFTLRFVFLACIALSYLAVYWVVDFYNLS